CTASVLMRRPPPPSTRFPYTTLFRSDGGISLGTVIINQVPPHPEADIVSPTEHAFAAEGTIQVGWQRSEPTGLVRLRELGTDLRSEEHTSELQSRFDLVCRLLLEKKK